MLIKLPYTEDIIWKINKKGCLDVNSLSSYKDKILNNDNIHNVICYGGLLEIYISLYLLLHLKNNNNNKTNFIGHYKFNNFVKKIANCSTNSYLLNKNFVEKYPAPVFFDLDHNIYYNIIYNLYNEINYAGIDIGEHNKVILKVINNNIIYNNLFSNPIDISKLLYSNYYLNWKKNNKNLLKIPYILVIPGNTNLSLHTGKYLNWSLDDCLNFSNLMKKLGIFVIIMETEKFTSKKQYNHINFGVSQYLDLVGSAFMVLADDIDLILIKAIKDYNGYFAFNSFEIKNKFYSIVNNLHYLRGKFDYNFIKNNILIKKSLSPNDIYIWLKEKL